MKKIWLIISLVVFFMACDSKDSDLNDNYSLDNQEVPSFDFLEDLEGLENGLEGENQEENIYLTFIKSKEAVEENFEVLNVQKRALDLETGVYVFVYLGRPDEMGNTIYILKDSSELEWVGKIYEEGFLEDFDFVKMKGSEKTYLRCFLTNYVNCSGFQLYEIKDEQVKALWEDSLGFSAFSGTSLVDADDDGYMDALTWGAFTYNVLYYPTTKVYTWQDESFHIMEHDVEVGPYPQTLDEVIKHFIELHALQEGSKDIEGRLKAINPKGLFYDKTIISFDDIQSSAIILEGFIEYTVTEEENTGLVVIENGSNGKSNPYKITFMMVRKDGRWVVDGIENDRD